MGSVLQPYPPMCQSLRRGGSPANAALRYSSAPLVLALMLLALSSCVSGPRFSEDQISSTVVVEERNRHTLLTAREQSRATGLIFYPGGLVAGEAYIPLLDDLAEAGYPVLIVDMPLGLAVFAPLRGLTLTTEYPGVARWIIAGHSLGGAMAARAVHREPDALAGLILLASYPANSDDLSDRDIPTVSIFAERDGLATPEEIESSTTLLPPTTVFVEIAGGNHAQFGAYGPQDGDNEATIAAEVQQRLTVRAMLQLLDSFNPEP